MARPKRIILIKHGLSEGNIDHSVYESKPDFAVELTDWGKKQAYEAGIKLKEIIKDESVRFIVSPFFRTRRTFDYLVKSFDKNKTTIREDIRLTEQSWGNLVTKEEQEKTKKERDEFSHFYYRGSCGESSLDAYVRISSFLETLHRDFEKDSFEDNLILVTHGLTIRLFFMRWFHMTVEQYEEIKNPYNCQYFILQLNDKNKYDLITPLTKHRVYHNWKYETDDIDLNNVTPPEINKSKKIYLTIDDSVTLCIQKENRNDFNELVSLLNISNSKLSTILLKELEESIFKEWNPHAFKKILENMNKDRIFTVVAV